MKDDPQELFIVVDENDIIIGYRSRYDCHHDKSLIHRAVGIIVYNEKGEILLQKRSKNKDIDPGLYEISSSGHLNKGESYEEAAKREMMEELGVFSNLTFIKKVLLHLPQETEYDTFFKTIHNGTFYINTQEIDEVKFFTEAEVRENKSRLTVFASEGFKIIGVL